MGINKNPETERRLEHIKTTVKAAGIKLTHQRLEIFREIVENEAHPDVETVFRAVQPRMPTVSLDTVYRTLWLLHSLGLATTLGPQGDGIRFDANLSHHHHYVCVRCGLVRDFESHDLNSLRLPDSVTQIGSVVDAHVEVRGVCALCAQKNELSTKKSPKRKPTKKTP